MKTAYRSKRLLSVALLLLAIALVLVSTLSFSISAEDDEITIKGKLTRTIPKGNEASKKLLNSLIENSNYYILVRHKHLGGSHYAYTDALQEINSSDDQYVEYNFNGGSSMVLLTVVDKGDKVEVYEYTLMNSTTGVIRDPDVSADGTKVLYSFKRTTSDDYHIYEMDIATKETKQLTFGSGHSDIEPKYLPNGNIVFNSNRCVQTVDCWITPVCNLYIMEGDGSNIIRVGYDQVHTTYPTVTDDGRVIYTRWDYNDRTQMYVQGAFQMFADGTNQTELFADNANFPTTLLHTREIPGQSGKYISIASGHHVYQSGKVVVLDTNVDRESPDAVQYNTLDSRTLSKPRSVDSAGYPTTGNVYKYPYALNENEFLVAASKTYSGGSTNFDIYLMNNTGTIITLAEGETNAPASQIVPVKTRDPFNRASSVDYSSNTGTYYVSNVYEGEGMDGVKPGSVKYLRVVELQWRTTSIGATYQAGSGTGDPFTPIATGNGSWDVKAVLGITDVESDGSALFSVPSDTPVYFQLLDENGRMIQTMRSWSTLMRGEIYSCVGCHENNNTSPSSGSMTIALKRGVQKLKADTWMGMFEEYEGFDPYSTDSIGFSYLNTVQRIFDKSCIECHSNTDKSFDEIGALNLSNGTADLYNANYIIAPQDVFTYSVDGKAVGTDYAPFGALSSGMKDINTLYDGNTLQISKGIFVTKYDYEACVFKLTLKYSGKVTVKINGKQVYTATKTNVTEETIVIDSSNFTVGNNTFSLELSGGKKYIDLSLNAGLEGANEDVVLMQRDAKWKYLISTSSTAVSNNFYQSSFDDSSWKEAKAPFGSLASCNTTWNDANGNYIWLRTSFNITSDVYEKILGGKLIFDMFYDDHCTIYLNGTQVFTNTGWNTSFERISINYEVSKVLKVGENNIAVKLGDTGGDHYFGTGITVVTASKNVDTSAVFSLEGAMTESSRMMKKFPLSYLLLTGSTPSYGGNQAAGYHYIGKSSNKYIKWISTMSVAEVLPAYYAGSTQSTMISKLMAGHGNLTKEEIALISCWIDLAVPCFGEYDDCNTFNASQERQYQETVNKRNYYTALDEYTKLSLASLTPTGSISITYKPASGNESSATGNGIAYLYVKSKYASGDTVSIELGDGNKYAFVCINGRLGETLVYAPDGKIEFTLNNTATIYPLTVSGRNYYRDNTITVRIPTSDELKSDRNLALNPFDGSTSTAFPHVISSGDMSGAQYAGRNVIDGFSVNSDNVGKWPTQAWRPTNISDSSIKIDFGRQVVVNELIIYSAKDTSYLISAAVEFSNGEKQVISLRNTSEGMSFDLGGRTVTSITLTNLVSADSSSKASIAEIKVIGHET